MTTLWDTNGNQIIEAVAAARRNAGGVSGLALTLVVVADENLVAEALSDAATAAAAHPCRLLVVVRRDVTAEQSRLDADIEVGGKLGSGESVVMRMYGRLALHAESVTLPLLAPDVPVVTWWNGPPPENIAEDPLGVFADRRITDSARAKDPIAALRQRALDYVAGDTDLAWSRATPWRSLIADSFDTLAPKPVAASIAAPAGNPTAALLAGWIADRVGVVPEQLSSNGPGITSVRLELDDGSKLVVERPDGVSAVLRRTGLSDKVLPLRRRDIGEELAEELRHLNPDETYRDALSRTTGVTGLQNNNAVRVHKWHDPALVGGAQP